jgi:hypothetical protein
VIEFSTKEEGLEGKSVAAGKGGGVEMPDANRR